MRYRIVLEKRKKNGKLIKENVPIRIVVNHKGQRLTLTAGFNIDSSSWNSDREAVKQGHSNAKGEPYNYINSILAKQKQFIDSYAVRYEIENKEILLDDLKKWFASEFSRKKRSLTVEPEINLSFYNHFDKFVEERGRQNSWSLATYTKFKAVRKHLLEFDKRLSFETLNDDKLTDYVAFLRESEQMLNSTISKQLGFLKWFLNWSVDKGFNTNIEFKGFKPKLKTAEQQVIYLSPDEVNDIRELQIPDSKQYLERVRDVFLFCCYTSLRYSDAKNLKRSDINGDKMQIVTQKTTDKLNIKLVPDAVAILYKYKEFQFEKQKALPVISNQKMNDYLKDLCKLAEIDQPITKVQYKGNQRLETTQPKYQLIGTHTARRTFICNALANGMPPHAVMKITGHSDYKAMQPYIDIIGSEVDDMMDKYVTF